MKLAKQVKEICENLTFAEAQNRIWSALKEKNWKTSAPDLKIRWATPPQGTLQFPTKVWFKSQAIYVGQSKPVHSMHVNAKEIAAMTSEEIENKILSYMK